MYADVLCLLDDGVQGGKSKDKNTSAIQKTEELKGLCPDITNISTRYPSHMIAFFSLNTAMFFYAFKPGPSTRKFVHWLYTTLISVCVILTAGIIAFRKQRSKDIKYVCRHTLSLFCRRKNETWVV